MKLTKTQLKQLIKEELALAIFEDKRAPRGTGAQTARSHDFNTALNDALVVLQRMEKVLRKIEFNTKSVPAPTNNRMPD